MAGRRHAHAIISGDYTRVVEVALDDSLIYSFADKEPATAHETLKDYSLEQLFVAIGQLSLEELSFLLDAAAVNRQAAMAGLASPAASRPGPALSALQSDLPTPAAAAYHAQCLTAAAGVAAGTVYLLGGSYADSVNAMQSVIGTLAGMVCDGAKESCAFKLSSSVALAVQFSYLALEGACISAGMGILGDTIEKTFENLGRLNNPGMVAADRLMLRMIADGRP
jgi:L-cysteine desulfidase